MYAVKPGAQEEDGSVETEADVHSATQGEAAIATVSDDMSFSEAFAAAREETGPGGVFAWRGNVYGTYMADEWETMSDDEKDLFAMRANTAAGQMEVDNHQEPEPAVEEPVAPDEVLIAEKAEEEATIVVQEPVATVDDELSANATTWDEIANEENEVRVVGYENVEVGDGQSVIMQELDVNGQRVALIDVDNDGVADLVMSDLNHNYEMDEGEVIDLQTGEAVSFTNDDMPVDDSFDATI